MFADLHIHTTFSDGASTPQEVVRMAAQAKLQALAITDHDTMDGFPLAKQEATRLGIDIITGVELSTEHEATEIHILAYCIDQENVLFQEHMNIFRQARLNRAQKIVLNLQHLGLKISLDQVLRLAGSGSLGRPHIARALMQNGSVSSIGQAFENYLGFGKPAYEPRLKYDPTEMITLVRDVGGVPVLAHPGISGADKLLETLIKYGLQGMEVHHPKHTPELENHYLALCQTHDLVATGGSDFHGMGIAGHGRIGEAKATYATVSKLRTLALSNKK